MSNEFHFNIELYPEDSKKLIPIDIDVPDGIKEIVIRGILEPETLSHEESKKPIIDALKKYVSQGFEPLEVKNNQILEKIWREFSPLKNIVNLRIIDSEGKFRGTGDNRFTKGIPIKIGVEESTLGCVTGGIPPGEWKLILEVKQILKRCILNIVVFLNRENSIKIADPILPYTSVLREWESKEGWVKGDFHLHSNHSDGALSIEELIKFSIKRGLDFIFLTDHNKISGYHTIEDEGYPIFGGIEFTTFWGHFLGLGIYDYIPWDLVNPNVGIRRLAEKVHYQEGIFCISHPFTLSYPICPGCRCEIPIDYDFVDAIEVWTGTFSLRKFEITEGIKEWRRILKEGYKITAIGSSDMHKIEDIRDDTPVNYVYVDNLTLENIIRSVREGKVYVTSGPKVEFYINDKTIGETLRTDDDMILKYSCEEEADLKIIYNGEEFIKIPKTKRGAFQIRFDDKGYVYLEFWQGNKLLAFTNPIYLM